MDKPWLKHYEDGVPETIDYPRIPLDQFLRDAAGRHPHHVATIFGSTVAGRVLDETMTYAELDATVDRFAAALQGLGVAKGDRVMVMLPNCPQFIIAAYAIWRIGGAVVCCNPLYVEREVQHLLADSGARVAVVMSSLYGRVENIRAHTNLDHVIVTNIKEYFPGLLKTLFTLTKERREGHRVNISGRANTYWFQDVLAQGPAKPAPVNIDPQDLSTLIYTGGTTGRPKGVQLSHFNLVSNTTTLSAWGKIKEAEDVMVAVMPYFHVYGMTGGLNTCIANALTIVLVANPRDIVHVLSSIEKHKVTLYPGVPAMFIAFNNHPKRDKFDLTTLRFAISAAAPLPPEVQAKFENVTGGKLLEAYGLTETSPALTADPVETPRPGSIGIPVPDTDVKIVDTETGTIEMPVGEIGEIIVKGPQVMGGYWQLPTETANAIRNGPDYQPGWFFTGDIGYMDEDGFFHISDRKKDLIIAGGYNIYPAEVEAVLYEHPQVQEAAVIGIPHELRGETVKAFVVLKEGGRATAEEIIAFCRERMAVYKAPTIIEFRSDLPKSVVGKVLRRELREG